MKRPTRSSHPKIGKPSREHGTPSLPSVRPLRNITPRETQILQLIWAGYMNRDIGHRLKISVRTVEAHRSSIMLKLGVSNTAQLLRHAIQLGFIKTSSP